MFVISLMKLKDRLQCINRLTGLVMPGDNRINKNRFINASGDGWLKLRYFDDEYSLERSCYFLQAGGRECN